MQDRPLGLPATAPAAPCVKQSVLESQEIANIRAHLPRGAAATGGSMFRLSVVDHVRLNFDRTSQNYTTWEAADAWRR
jgi:hypothetical protein